MKRGFPRFGYNPVTGEWNDSLAGEFLWSNANVSEAVPDVMTPSTWSLWWIFHYETNPVQFPGGHPFCGNICGRPYLNLSVVASAHQALGRDPRQALRGDIVGSASANLDIPTLRFSALTVYRTILPGAFKAHAQARRDRKNLAAFLATMPAWCRSMRPAIAECRDSASLLGLWQENFKPAIVRACNLLRSMTMLLSKPGTQLRMDLTALVGQAEANILLSNFSGEGADLESLGPLVGLAKVAQGKMNAQEYRERYGHRGPHEMELSAPDADDDPAWLERQLADFTRSAVDVDALLARQRAEHTAAWQRLESRFPSKAKTIRHQLATVAAAARNREAVRSEVTRAARTLRCFLRRAGEITGLGDDIFFLSLDEMVEALEGDKTSLYRIPARREIHQRYCALPPYPPFIVGHFDPFRWAADPQRRNDYFDARHPASAPTTNSISGFAGAVGCAEGYVRRIDHPEEGHLLQAGEVLVTVTTNIGWTPLFPRLAAIVTDVGAPLSHAAIVARELGIPAVVGCGNATTRLKSGDRVRVDGGRGIVEIL